MSYWLSRYHPIQAWVEVSQQPFFGENYETDSTWICSFRVMWNYAKNLLKSAVFAKTKSNLAQNRVKFCRKMLSHLKTGSNFAKKTEPYFTKMCFFWQNFAGSAKQFCEICCRREFRWNRFRETKNQVSLEARLYLRLPFRWGGRTRRWSGWFYRDPSRRQWCHLLR